MLRTLRIKDYRGLREFAMSGLGRVNLLVGTNNCGKTSVLEAIQILSIPGTYGPLRRAQLRRGEVVDSVEERQFDVAHLVHGHRISAGAGFRIEGESERGLEQLTASFSVPTGVHNQLDLLEADQDDDIGPGAAPMRARMWLELDWSLASQPLRLPITAKGGWRDGPLPVPRNVDADAGGAVVSVTTDGLARNDIVSLFESVVLTADEEFVLGALRTIEPTIERIASIGGSRTPSSSVARGGLAMMVGGRRIPIGSMGDGIWRLLGISLALVRARGGVLLVDEIDTGLHYSVLVDMWRLVLATARSLDVQVFATTHSRDCYEALAAVTEDDRNEISLQRIERGKVEAIGFTEAEIRQAAERGLEVR